jgi:hypothetical protein
VFRTIWLSTNGRGYLAAFFEVREGEIQTVLRLLRDFCSIGRRIGERQLLLEVADETPAKTILPEHELQESAMTASITNKHWLDIISIGETRC